MSEEQSVPAFRTLPMARRQGAIALIGRMALRQLRSAVRATGERCDDLRICHGPAERKPAGEGLRPTS